MRASSCARAALRGEFVAVSYPLRAALSTRISGEGAGWTRLRARSPCKGTPRAAGPFHAITRTTDAAVSRRKSKGLPRCRRCPSSFLYNEQYLVGASLERLSILSSSPHLDRVEVIVVEPRRARWRRQRPREVARPFRFMERGGGPPRSVGPRRWRRAGLAPRRRRKGPVAMGAPQVGRGGQAERRPRAPRRAARAR